MDADVASTLSGFALGDVLGGLGLDEAAMGAMQSQLGIKRTNAFSRDSIYADKFADDDLDDDDLEDEREDFEAMIDREMREEKFGKPAASASRAGAGKLMRGEEDDFDEDYDEKDEPMGDAPAVKQEPREEDDDLFGSPPPEAEQEPMEFERLAAPPARKADVKDLFPTFREGAKLDFTELFGMRPRKKRRVVNEGVKRASFVTRTLQCMAHGLVLSRST